MYKSSFKFSFLVCNWGAFVCVQASQDKYKMWLPSLIFFLLLEISWCFIMPKMLSGRPLTGFRKQFHRFDSSNVYDDDAQMFEQLLDHFDPRNNVTWNQRFWNIMDYAKPNGPQFLAMGQEAPGGGALQNKYWAQNFSGGLWALEHRFYGKSQPFEKQTIENLKYLTSRQYLADVANFIRTQNERLNLTNPKWIVIGGSYAGSLALWFRQLYPELAVGAVGSSAPIQPVLDFYEYNQIVENSFRHRDPKCAKNIKIAFKQLEKLMEYNEGRDDLNIIFKNNLELFNVTSDNIQNFYSLLIGIFEEQVQYDYTWNQPISKICKFMNMPSNNKIMNLGIIYSHFTAPEGTEQRYQGTVDYLNYTSYENLYRAATRSWVWQTCNEFGFFGTTDSGNSFFGSKISLNYYIDLCMDVFGEEYDADHIKAGIANTLKLYGGTENYTGTNVIAPRGSIDPWSALALKASNDPTVIPYLIEEGSHCSDMSEPNESDSESLKNLRALILQNMKRWIGISPINNSSDVVKNRKEKKLFVSEISWSNVSKRYEYKPSHHLHNGFRCYKLLHERLFREKLYKDAEVMNMSENTISQPFDHFNKTDGKTWNQRFWNNSVFYKVNGPIFLLIGGEDDGGARFIDLEVAPISIWAKQYGADLYFLEHRGYGKSLPAHDPSIENLKSISSEQALADMANFIEAINKIRPNAKWITFGGSYPGTLSAWFREMYPEMTVGAVASSAPMLPKIDFFEYQQVVEKVIYEKSPKCGENLKIAFADLQSKLYSIEGRKEINKLFNTAFSGKSPDFNEIQNFLSGMTDVFAGTVQYGDSLRVYCESMLNASNTPLENLASFDKHRNYKKEDMGNEQSNDNKWNAYTSWNWQTCTEFGWYQTTDSGRNIFGTAVSIDGYINQCYETYGKNITDIAASVDYTLKTYGGLDNYNATNVVFINGSHDPWHAISLYTNNTSPSGITSILINGTSHCADMMSPTDYDSDELIAARQKIGELIREWLK